MAAMTPAAPAAPASPPRPNVVIIGAGPAGCLLALLLSQQDLTVHVYDYRPDPRAPSSPGARKPSNRSINLALSTRGLTALSLTNLSHVVTSAATAMHGRCIHSLPTSAPLQFHRYGLPGQHLLSVSRARLNNLLLDECDGTEAIHLNFGMRCVAVDLDGPSTTLQSECGETFTVDAELVVGADGAFSAVRAAMARRPRFDYSQTYVSAAYKELRMTNVRAAGRGQAFPPEWLHVWPRHRFMLIALPNGPDSFTATLFMDKGQIDALQTPGQIGDFFHTNFPDAINVMPSLVEDFVANPTPSLLTVRCKPYHYLGKAVLIGDAAHAMVPFYGQGCNAAFEDCRLLAEAIQKHGWDNLHDALESYSRTRKENADAIADLAVDHYEDMSSRSAKPFFVFKRKLEILANRFFPKSFLPLYSMVSFSNIPYAEAVRRADDQDKTIERYLAIFGVAALSSAALVALRAVSSRAP